MDPILVTALMIVTIYMILFYIENRKPKRYPAGRIGALTQLENLFN